MKKKYSNIHFSKAIKGMPKAKFTAWFKQRYPGEDAEIWYNKLHPAKETNK